MSNRLRTTLGIAAATALAATGLAALQAQPAAAGAGCETKSAMVPVRAKPSSKSEVVWVISWAGTDLDCSGTNSRWYWKVSYPDGDPLGYAAKSDIIASGG